MSDRSLDHLHPSLLPICRRWLEACDAALLKVGISQTYRSKEEQDATYAIGRTLPGNIKTNAKGGESPHNCILPDGTPAAKAFDFFIYDSNGKLDWDTEHPSWKKAIALGESLGLVSGEYFKFRDYAHLELKDWKTV